MRRKRVGDSQVSYGLHEGSNCGTKPGRPIVLPRYLRSDKVDFEAELGVVIGRPCKNVKPEEALSYVLGYVCANDVSARDWQKKRGWTILPG